MQLRNLAILRPLALLATAATAIACGGGSPAADSAIGASPVPGGTPISGDTIHSREALVSSDSTPAVAETATPAKPAAAADTVRGIVSEVGSFPMISVVVQPASGGAVTITGALAREIGRAAGAVVQVSGQRSARSLEAASYSVRSVDGDAAADGVLAVDGGRLVLVTDAGRRPIARPLQALRGMIGARVWLVGPLDGTITSYGVLREP